MNSNTTPHHTSRRSVLTVGAWSIPALATTAAVPTTSTSGEATMVPGIAVTSGNSPWTDRLRYSGYIAEGIVINLADQQGRPMPVGTVVTLRLIPERSRWKHNNIYFIDNPDMSAHTARRLSHRERHQQFTLVTNTPGHLSLYPTPTTGYLRKGSNGERPGVHLTVEAGGMQGSALIINSSAAGGTNPGIEPAS